VEWGKGMPKEREVNRRREVERGVSEAIGPSSILRLIRSMSVSLAREDVVNLRFELGVESRAAETELVLVVLRMLNS